MTEVVILSGGLDSTVAATRAVQALPKGEEKPRALTFDYGQRHVREIEAAQGVAAYLGLEHRVIDLRGLLSGSALVDQSVPVPHGHYAADTMQDTVVNGRNLLFVAVAVAACQPGDRLWLGVHSGDHAIYPDCREEFWSQMQRVVGDAYGVALRTPFVVRSKADIAREGARIDAPMHLSWSCYEGGAAHCGRCGTCVERAEAFALAEVPDPTVYADPHYWREAIKG